MEIKKKKTHFFSFVASMKYNSFRKKKSILIRRKEVIKVLVCFALLILAAIDQ